MSRFKVRSSVRLSLWPMVLMSVVSSAPHRLRAQTPAPPASSKPIVPAWAQPGSATHTQVAPPSDFHRATRTSETPIGIFSGQSDVGGALFPGSATFDAGDGRYTITSAGYNIWYSRDEFHYVWKKMSGDVSLAADISFPDAKGYDDRKAVLVIRQDLEDDSKEAVVALHGGGLVHLALRPEKNAQMADVEYRIGSRGFPGVASSNGMVTIMAKRIGIEKKGDAFALFVSTDGEPMHQFGPPLQLHLKGPFFVGIGFCSHLPDKADTAVLSNVLLDNASGKVH